MRYVIPALLALTLLGCKSREEKLKAAEEEGNLLVATKAKLVEGVGKALQEEGKIAGEAIAAGTGEVVKGVGAGYDKSLTQVKLAAHQELAGKGLTATRAAIDTTQEQKRVVTVYVVADKPYTGPLELRAYDAKAQEIGRTRVQFEEAEATAKYVDFPFDERTPLLTADHFELR